MKYYAVDFHIECGDGLMQACRELLADAAGEAGFESFEDTDDGITGYVQTDLFDREGLEQAINSFPIEGTNITYETRQAEDRDWNTQWEEAGFDPIIINGKCIIYDARQQGATPLSSLLAPLCIAIDARMAFGTGTHETTRMVVSQLLGLEIEGNRVLDCGCGTGILAIAAAKLGASHVVAYDIDEWSVENAQANFALNDVEGEIVEGDASILTQAPQADILLANINRNILLADLPAFVAKLRPRSRLLLSGFLEDDIPFLVQKAADLGLTHTGTYSDGDWRALEFIVS